MLFLDDDDDDTVDDEQEGEIEETARIMNRASGAVDPRGSSLKPIRFSTPASDLENRDCRDSSCCAVDVVLWIRWYPNHLGWPTSHQHRMRWIAGFSRVRIPTLVPNTCPSGSRPTGTRIDYSWLDYVLRVTPCFERAGLPVQFTDTSDRQGAIFELRIIKMSATVVLLASPFLAIGFLGAIQSAMRPGQPLVDRFGTRLCFIAVAVRPCAYLLKILRPDQPSTATHHLTAIDELKVRSQAFEKALVGRAAVAATTSDLAELRDRIKEPIEDLCRALDTLARHRKSVIPATTTAQQVLTQTTARLAQRTQNLVDAVNERASLAAQRKASASAVLLARTNEFITSTGTTLQRLGTTLAPPQANPDPR
ncbi:hypothetical protein H4Q26_011188 [Puccinia striiformis f. sp. tritici PST-130]|nr:hypothetical protein H4Q26_011188 [Puccinia striiformis f. sp. tritici PST-130]